MSDQPPIARSHECWARFRFSVIGPLLAAPPEPGQLQAQLEKLAAQTWRHPLSGEPVQFGFSTIEGWYYTARKENQDPVAALQRKRRADAGQHPALQAKARELLTAQYQQHPDWSYQLHADNLWVLLEQQPELGSKPCYASIVRYLKAHGLFKRPRRGPAHSPGAQVAEQRFERREVRSYETEYVHGLWHLDFHHGSLRVLLEDGRWAYPLLFGCLDDHSRLCCHAQWYLAEGAQELVHGLIQALEKRALPRALMSDNGAAMTAAETEQGLVRLGILHETTLPYSPYQNAKMEVFWAQIEGRLLPMLHGVADLTLAQLNEATLAWIELEYNRKLHSELGQSPLQRYLHHKEVGRPCPATEQLQLAFTDERRRTQRRSDGTLSLEGIRFEVPSRYRHFEWVTVRVAAWDLSRVYLSDPQTGAILCRLYPLDKHRNAQGQRAVKAALPGLPSTAPAPAATPAPLLQKLLKDYAATGLPPAYRPQAQSRSDAPADPTDLNPS